MEWHKRPDLNWCYFCWFNADIESKTNEICEKFICHTCGVSVHVHHGEDDPEAPRFFTDEEWDKFWKDNYEDKGA